jgi:hypothetical protein
MVRAHRAVKLRAGAEENAGSLSQLRWLNNESVRLSVLIFVAVAVLSGCQAPQTGTQTVPSGPSELTIQFPVEIVRSATIKTMTDRDYSLVQAGTDTLLFDRTADLGSALRIGFTDGKTAWRRVRIRLIPVGAATRVTAEPSLVINRGDPNEREEPDNSSSAHQVMLEILEKIRAQAGR